jgi:hypothetical protein
MHTYKKWRPEKPLSSLETTKPKLNCTPSSYRRQQLSLKATKEKLTKTAELSEEDSTMSMKE